MENRTIDMEKFNRYTRLNKVKDMFLGSPVYVPLLEFDRTRADNALKFLKARLEDDEFEFVNSTIATTNAIEALEKFETELKAEETRIIKERSDALLLKREAGTKTMDLINKKIEPMFRGLIEELEQMRNIEGFSWVMGADKRRKLLSKLEEVISLK